MIRNSQTHRALAGLPGPAMVAVVAAGAVGALMAAPAEAAGWHCYVDTDRSGISDLNAYFGQPYDTCLVGDFDGDGRSDFAAIRKTSSQWRWYIDTNRNGFSNLSPQLAEAASSGTLLALDIDGDHRDDIVTVRKSGSAWRWAIDSDRDGTVECDVAFGVVDTDGVGENRSDRLVPADPRPRRRDERDTRAAVAQAVGRRLGRTQSGRISGHRLTPSGTAFYREAHA